MNKKIVIPLVVILFCAILTSALIILTLPKPIVIIPYEGTRKAIIVCSANDFYGSETEDDFNGSPDANFEFDTNNWTRDTINCWADFVPIFGNKTPGSIQVRPTGGLPVSANMTFSWDDPYTLREYAFYNMSVMVYINSTTPVIGEGAKIGLQWLDSGNSVIRTDWSSNINSALMKWTSLSIMGVCNNETGSEISKLKLVLSTEGQFAAGPDDSLYYDDVIIDTWISVNLTDPTDPDPPPARINSDGFPAQALQAYWILKNHGYSDDDIFLMLYHTNDSWIDIDFFDGPNNDLSGAVIDVKNEDVNASRFKQELNVSISGSFAYSIDPKDQLIIYMVDHGSNAKLGDGNATFHFEADNSWIDEFEFYELVKNIGCERMLICLDCCFSGNFLNENKNIGQSWYDLPNCLFISAASNIFSWYWINNKNPDGFAGSWFFHPFWQHLDQNNTIIDAYNFAAGFIPSAGQPRPVVVIQNPLLHDNLLINDTWSFDGDPQL
jgi:hypothetical protein